MYSTCTCEDFDTHACQCQIWRKHRLVAIANKDICKGLSCMLSDLMILSCKLDCRLYIPLSQIYKPLMSTPHWQVNRIILIVAYLLQILSPWGHRSEKKTALKILPSFFFLFKSPCVVLKYFSTCQFISYSITDSASFITLAVAAHSFLLCVCVLHLPSSVWEGGSERQFDRGTRDMSCSQWMCECLCVYVKAVTDREKSTEIREWETSLKKIKRP